MLTETEMRAALRDWVLHKASDLDASLLTDRTALFEQRYLRSVHVPELLLLLEGLRGRPIDLDELEPGHFRDIDTLIRRFGNQGPAA